MQQIKFTKGLSRLEGVGLGSPFDIKNARLEPIGEVQAHSVPILADDSPHRPKPWYRHAGHWLQLPAVAAEGYNGRLYVHQESPWPGDDIPHRYWSIPRTWDGNMPTNPVDFHPPSVFVGHSGMPGSLSQSNHRHGVRGGHTVTYLVIPYNQWDEQGPWFYLYYENTGSSGGAVRPLNQVICNKHVAYVEIYRTKAIPRTFIENKGFGQDAARWPDASYYFIEKVDTTPWHSDQRVARWLDKRYWPLDPGDQDSDPLPDAMTQIRNVWAMNASVTQTLHPGARRLYNHAGVMMHGDVKWPVKQPHVMFQSSAWSPHYHTAFQLEYATPDGPVWSDPLFVNNATRVNIAPTEATLIVYVRHTDGVYYEFERLKLGNFGQYHTQYVTGGNVNWAYTFSNVAYMTHGKQTDIGIRPATRLVAEPHRVLMSVQNRPLTVTFNGFDTPDSRRVVAIAGARLAEEEAIRAYDFYVFTDQNSYVVRRDGYAAFLDHLISGVGCVESDRGLPILVSVKAGVVFYGTDRKLYFLSGRGATDLSFMVGGLWNTIRDVAYNVLDDEILVATDTGVWIYSFVQQGWIGHLNEPGITDLQFDPEVNQAILFRNRVSVVDTNTPGTIQLTAIDGPKPTGTVAQGRLRILGPVNPDPNPPWDSEWVDVTFAGVTVRSILPEPVHFSFASPEMLYNEIVTGFNSDPVFSNNWVASHDQNFIYFTAKTPGSEWNGFWATVMSQYGRFGADPYNGTKSETILVFDNAPSTAPAPAVGWATLVKVGPDPDPPVTSEWIDTTFHGVTERITISSMAEVHETDVATLANQFNSNPTFAANWTASNNGTTLVVTAKANGSAWNGFGFTVVSQFGTYGSMANQATSGGWDGGAFADETVTLNDGIQSAAFTIGIASQQTATASRDIALTSIQGHAHFGTAYNVSSGTHLGQPAVFIRALVEGPEVTPNVTVSTTNPFVVTSHTKTTGTVNTGSAGTAGGLATPLGPETISITLGTHTEPVVFTPVGGSTATAFRDAIHNALAANAWVAANFVVSPTAGPAVLLTTVATGSGVNPTATFSNNMNQSVLTIFSQPGSMVPAETVEFQRWLPSLGSERYRDASVTTQPMKTVGTIDIAAIKVDYDPIIFSSIAQAANNPVGSHILNITDPLFTESAVLSPIILADGFRTVITTYSLPTQVLIADPIRTAVTGEVRWGNVAKYKHTVRTTPLNEYVSIVPIPANRMRYPHLKGRQVSIEMRDFDRLREIVILTSNTLTRN